MDLSQEDVIRIMKIINESDFDELKLDMGDLKIVLSKQGSATSIEQHEASSAKEKSTPISNLNTQSTAGNDPAPQASAALKDTRQNKDIIAEKAVEEGLVPIKAPMLGTFYTSPEPGEPSFVEVGTVVTQETTICIIEVMKLFSSISAGISGRIARVCAEDGQMVEYDQVLFLVDPETD
jgi:acetyl-CoA carboxylase biotin carboxyl carrier protein